MDWYADVWDHVFSDVKDSEANSLWKKELAKPAKEDADKDENGDD